MCGRYVQAASPEELRARFRAAWADALEARYNIAPTQWAPVVRVHRHTGERRIDLLAWGLIPRWAKDRKIAHRLINARAETLARKPAFRDALARRRCLVPCSGFYEWKRVAGGKQPYYITRVDGAPFGLAGLWERWWAPDGEGMDGERIDSFAIITVDANELVRELHDRMPLILAPEAYDLWLDPGVTDADALAPLLRTPGPEGYTTYPVSRLVNRPENDVPACIEPAPEGLF